MERETVAVAPPSWGGPQSGRAKKASLQRVSERKILGEEVSEKWIRRSPCPSCDRVVGLSVI